MYPCPIIINSNRRHNIIIIFRSTRLQWLTAWQSAPLGRDQKRNLNQQRNIMNVTGLRAAMILERDMATYHHKNQLTHTLMKSFLSCTQWWPLVLKTVTSFCHLETSCEEPERFCYRRGGGMYDNRSSCELGELETLSACGLMHVSVNRVCGINSSSENKCPIFRCYLIRFPVAGTW